MKYITKNYSRGLSKFSIAIILVTSFFAVGTITPWLIDWEQYRPNVLSALHKATGYTPQIEGTIDVSFLPTPSMTIESLSFKLPNTTHADANTGVDTNIETTIASAEDVTVYWSIFSALVGKLSVSSVEATNLNTDILSALNLLPNNKTPLPITLDMLEISNINLERKSFDFEGTIPSKNQELSIFGNIGGTGLNGTPSSTIYLSSPSFNIELNGQGNITDRHGSFKGELSAKGSNVADFISLLYQQPSGASGTGTSNTNTNEPFTFSSTLNFSPQALRFESISIASTPLKGDGQINIIFEHVPAIEYVFRLKQLDLDKLTGTGDAPASNAKTGHNLPLLSAFTMGELPKNMSMLFDITADEMHINTLYARDVAFSADLFNGKLAIERFAGALPDIGKSQMLSQGILTHNGIRPRFEGELAVIGTGLAQYLRQFYSTPQSASAILPIDSIEDTESSNDIIADISSDTIASPTTDENLTPFHFKSRVVIVPNKISLSELETNLGDTNLSGELTIKTGEAKPKINAKMHFTQLDGNEFHLPQLVNHYFTQQLKQPDLQFLWLRTSQYDVELTLNVKELTLQDKIFAFGTHFTLAPGVFTIDEFTLSNKDNAITNGSLTLNVNKLKPEMDVTLQCNSLEASTLGLLSHQNTIIASSAPTEDSNTKKPFWSSSSLDHTIFQNINGTFEFECKNISISNIMLSDSSLKGTLNNQRFNIEEGKTSIAGGNAQLLGLISVETAPAVSLSFAGNNIEIGQILNDFTEKKNHYTGRMSVTGSIITYGRSPMELVSNMRGNLGLAARGVTMYGMNLDRITTESVFVPYSEFGNFVYEVKDKGKTIFKRIDGTATIEKGVINSPKTNFVLANGNGALAGALDLKWLNLRASSQLRFIPTAQTGAIGMKMDFEGSIKRIKKEFDLEQIINVRETFNTVRKSSPRTSASGATRQNTSTRDGAKEANQEKPSRSVLFPGANLPAYMKTQ